MLERLLTTPRGWAIAQQFMPESAEGWKIFATDAPNRWVAAHRGYYFHLSSRTGGGMEYDLPALDRRIDEIEAVGSKFGIRFRIRAVWHNDTHGHGYVWYVDGYMAQGERLPTECQIEEALADGITREDGQSHSFDLSLSQVSGSDHFDYDHYSAYTRVPRYV